MSAIWQRVHGASTGGTPTGLHGSRLAYTKATPSGIQLSTTDRDDAHRLHRPRLRGRRDELRRGAGGPGRGDAHDPEAAEPDRQEGHDRPDRPGRDEDRRLRRLPGRAVRREHDGAGEREAGSGREEHRATTRPSTRSSSRSASERSSSGSRSPRCVVALVALLAVAMLGRQAAADPAWRSRRSSAARRRTSSTSRSRCRGGSTTSTRAVDEVAGGLTRVDRRVDSAVTNTSVVRYDAYEDSGGQQSASFAFLDATRTGTVVTAIQGRDYARVYVKELDRGSPVRRPLARGGRGGRARDGPLDGTSALRRSAAESLDAHPAACGSVGFSGAFRAVRPGRRPCYARATCIRSSS